MELKTFLFFLVLFVRSTYIVAFATKYEYISDWRCTDLNPYSYPETFNMTLICGETNNENVIFQNTYQQYFECNSAYDRTKVNFNSVVNINFENCRFPEIKRNFFQYFPKLEIFNISNVELETIDEEKFEGAKKLTTLIASHNRITEWPVKLFNNLNRNLTYIDFSYNPLGNLNIETFAHLTNLEYLNLRRTNISNIKLGTFSFQPNLISLDLSENNLEILNFNNFLPNLKRLESLRLNGNKLRNYSLDGFKNALFPRLALLDIKNNEFSCWYLENFMSRINWEIIEISIDPNSIDVHQPSIRGINCVDDSPSNFVPYK